MQRRTQGPIAFTSLSLSSARIKPVTAKHFDEASLMDEPMVIPVQIGTQSISECSAFLDCGALAFGFIDADYAHSHSLPLQPLKQPRPLDFVDGSKSSSGWITHVCHTTMSFGNGSHQERISLFVTKLSDHPVILGLGWLKRHNPAVDFTTSTLYFRSSYCNANCLVKSTIVPPP